MADDPQMQLFARSTSSSRSAAPRSPVSSARATSSSEQSTTPTSDANSTGQTRRATGSSSRAGADAADMSKRDAGSTAACALQRTLPIFTAPNTAADPMLAIPRPKTRADCRAEARPCPWVGCRHHLLLEVATAKPRSERADPRATTLRLNRASATKTQGGRRPGLPSSAAAAIVRAWIDEAVELLSYMPYTCALDVVELFPDGLTPRRVGWLLGVTKQTVDAEGRKPGVRAALRALRNH